MSDASAAVNVKLIIMDTLVRAGQGRTVSAHHLMGPGERMVENVR